MRNWRRRSGKDRLLGRLLQKMSRRRLKEYKRRNKIKSTKLNSLMNIIECLKFKTRKELMSGLKEKKE
jgi:hypothetical protein